LDLGGLDELSDADALSRLQAIRGIGLWTAQMYVVFKLQRLDIFPLGDAGIRRAMTLLYSPELPVDDEWFVTVSNRWKPHRSTACRYLWRALDSNLLPLE
jgi:DNA-3-methyladenine glycosylase II